MTQLRLPFKYLFTKEDMDENRYHHQRELFQTGMVPVMVYYSAMTSVWLVEEFR